MRFLPALLLAASLYAAEDPELTRQVLYEVRQLREQLPAMNKQIIVNTQHLADVDRHLAEVDPLGNAAKIAALTQEVKAHEDEDKRIKAEAEKDHDTTMRRIDMATSVTAAAMLTVIGNVLVSWFRGKKHSAKLTAVETKSDSNAEEILRVSRAVADEVRRNNDVDSGQARQDKKIQDLEDREKQP